MVEFLSSKLGYFSHLYLILTFIRTDYPMADIYHSYIFFLYTVLLWSWSSTGRPMVAFLSPNFGYFFTFWPNTDI